MKTGGSPKRVRPRFPESWHVPEVPGKWVRWSHVRSKLQREQVYWVSTSSLDGRPHAAPVWGIWENNSFYFETLPKSVKGRNLSQNNRIIVHLQDGNDTAIVKGWATRIREKALLRKLVKAYVLKYDYKPNWSRAESDVVFKVSPKVVYAWKTPRIHTTMVKFVF